MIEEMRRNGCMGIYLVERTDEWDYDEHDSFVVICESEEETRSCHPRYEWSGKEWVQTIDVKLLGFTQDQPNGVVCASFNAG